MSPFEIKIAKLVGSGICVTSQDGQKAYAEIYKAIKSGHQIELSFFGVTRITTAFLNAAIGQLYGEFSSDEIRRFMLPPKDAEPWHLSRLKMVNDRAKQYFSDRKKYDAILNSELGIGGDGDS